MDTLAAWLSQKDRVPQEGVPSWHSLTRALAHPLVSQQGLAQEIARKHPKVILCMDQLCKSCMYVDTDLNISSYLKTASYIDAYVLSNIYNIYNGHVTTYLLGEQVRREKIKH